MMKIEVLADLKKYAVDVKHVVDPKLPREAVVLKLPRAVRWHTTHRRIMTLIRGKHESDTVFWERVHKEAHEALPFIYYDHNVDLTKPDEPLVMVMGTLALLAFVVSIIVGVLV